MFPLLSSLLHLLLLSSPPPTHSTSIHPPLQFSIPPSNALDNVNLLIGNGGDTPNGSGGMIPSTAPPFSMTRWVAQTQVSYVSATPFNWTGDRVMGFMGTRQPAIWMGESGSVAVVPGVGNDVVVDFEKRGLRVVRDDDGEKEEVVSVGYYSVLLEDGSGGHVLVQQTATSRVGHLRFSFLNPSSSPYVLLEVARPSILTSTPTNITYPHGSVHQTSPYEICGFNDERQDSIITPISIAEPASHFKGYFCARFDQEILPNSFGVIQNGTTTFPASAEETYTGPLLSAFVRFAVPQAQQKTTSSSSDNDDDGDDPLPATEITIRIGTSFISESQARANLDAEIPNVDNDTLHTLSQNFLLPLQDNPSQLPTARDVYPLLKVRGSFENTAYRVRSAWVDILSRIEVIPYVDDRTKTDDRVEADLQSFWTGVVHTLQYPNEQDEQGRYYSGYDNAVHDLSGPFAGSYTGYSIWDTYRAQWAWQILLVPERIPSMITSMLNDYREVGTHADSLIAEAVLKNITNFDLDLAWEAVWKDATVPPKDDWSVRYADREEHVDYEVRAGLSSVYNVAGKSWVADDVHSESASRTLDYAYDDYAAYVLAKALNKPQETQQFLYNRSMTAPFTLFNDATGFMEARNEDGSWAGDDNGWTEGDKWAYSFDVVHDIPTLIQRRGGPRAFVESLDAHFDGGHNDHTNEPSHHIPYLYALAGAAYKTQERVREIARSNYNNTPNGLSGNEDCGQMSAWFIFTSMGLYPVNPVSGEYVVGSPLFEQTTLHLPSSTSSRPLVIRALGARTKPYIKSVTINGVSLDKPIVRHDQIINGGELVFEMSDKVEAWGNELGVPTL